MGGLSLWHWLVVLVVVVLVFGTKRLRNVGQDLGEAVKGFRKGMRDGDQDADNTGDQSRDAAHPDHLPHTHDDRSDRDGGSR